MKIQLLTAALLASALTLSHADPKPLRVASIPTRADAPVLFAPRGWKIEKRISGNLNADKLPDLALVLVENKPAKAANGDPTARQRALVVLLKEGKGWHRVGFNGEVLPGTRDGGAFYGVVETPVDVTIKRGLVNINTEAGSRDVTTTTMRLRYEPKRQGVYLIGLDSANRDRLNGDITSTSTNFLTGIKRTATFKGNSNKGKTKTTRVPQKLRSLESLKESDRYAE